MAVSQAVVTAMLATPNPTPRHRIRVLPTYSVSTVEARWLQVAPVPPASKARNTDSTGTAASTAVTVASPLSTEGRPPLHLFQSIKPGISLGPTPATSRPAVAVIPACPGPEPNYNSCWIPAPLHRIDHGPTGNLRPESRLRRPPGGAGAQPAPGNRADLLPAGAFRLWQDDGPGLHRRLRDYRRRGDPPRRPQCQPPWPLSAARAAAHRHGVPGLRPVSPPDGDGEHRLRPAGHERCGQGCPGRRPPHHHRPGRARQQIPSRVVRRPATAGGPGPRPGAPSGPAAAGRALFQPRCGTAGASVLRGAGHHQVH